MIFSACNYNLFHSLIAETVPQDLLVLNFSLKIVHPFNFSLQIPTNIFPYSFSGLTLSWTHLEPSHWLQNHQQIILCAELQLVEGLPVGFWESSSIHMEITLKKLQRFDYFFRIFPDEFRICNLSLHDYFVVCSVMIHGPLSWSLELYYTCILDRIL